MTSIIIIYVSSLGRWMEGKVKMWSNQTRVSRWVLSSRLLENLHLPLILSLFWNASLYFVSDSQDTFKVIFLFSQDIGLVLTIHQGGQFVPWWRCSIVPLVPKTPSSCPPLEYPLQWWSHFDHRPSVPFPQCFEDLVLKRFCFRSPRLLQQPPCFTQFQVSAHRHVFPRISFDQRTVTRTCEVSSQRVRHAFWNQRRMFRTMLFAKVDIILIHIVWRRKLTTIKCLSTCNTKMEKW